MKNFKAMGVVKPSKQAGFTIIELVVVILLLGILAATALPRFLDVTDEAHDAAFSGTYGGFATGVGLYRAQWFAEGQGSGVMSDWPVNLPNSSGFPIGASGGTSTAITDTGTACQEIFANVLQAGAAEVLNQQVLTSISDDDAGASPTDGDLATANGTGDYVAVATANSECTYIYIADGTQSNSQARNIRFNSATGAISENQTW